jgi:hypothetical protein
LPGRSVGDIQDSIDPLACDIPVLRMLGTILPMLVLDHLDGLDWLLVGNARN